MGKYATAMGSARPRMHAWRRALAATALLLAGAAGHVAAAADAALLAQRAQFSRALELAGVTTATQAPSGGRIGGAASGGAEGGAGAGRGETAETAETASSATTERSSSPRAGRTAEMGVVVVTLLSEPTKTFGPYTT